MAKTMKDPSCNNWNSPFKLQLYVLYLIHCPLGICLPQLISQCNPL